MTIIYYTVYKITNLLNNMTYIGVHETDVPHDSYLGSGDFISAAVEVYGKENFKKEILSLHESKKAMYAEEKRIVNKEFVKRVDTYNLVVGGKMPPEQKGRKYLFKNKTTKNRTYEEIYGEEKAKELKQIRRTARLGTKFSDKTKQILRIQKLGKKNPMFGKIPWNKKYY